MRAISSLLLLFAGATIALAEDNPFKTAKVGDWVQYRSEVKLTTGQTIVTEMKQTVVGKTAKEATVKVELKAQGRWLPGANIKIPLDKPYDARTLMSGTGAPVPNAEELDKGEETIEVNKKKLACMWTKLKNTAVASGREVESVTTLWLCPEVPLGGLVKMASETNRQGVVMEATGWGKGR